MQPCPDTLQASTIWCSEPVRSCSLVLIPCRHVGSVVPKPWDPAAPSWYFVGMFDLVRSVVPNPWDHAATTWYLVSMFDLMFLTREIMQPRPDTSYACGTVVPFPLDHAAPPWLLVGMYVWCSLPVRYCSPVLIPCRHVGSVVPTREILQPRPYTLYAWWICCAIWCSISVRSCSPVLIRSTLWCSEPMRCCSPVLIPRRHVWSVVPNPWDTS